MEQFVINIGRQLGSGGRIVGEIIARQLGIRLYDKELINLAARESGIWPEIFEKADEKESRGVLSTMIGYLRAAGLHSRRGAGSDGARGRPPRFVLQLLQFADMGRGFDLPPLRELLGAGRRGHGRFHSGIRRTETARKNVRIRFLVY